MDLQGLIAAANSLADDMIPDEEVTEFINDAIAAIGIEVKATFPSLVALEDEPVIPEKWQRLLIVPFAKGRIKEKDSSQFEWEIGYEQFFENIKSFVMEYDVPEEYKDNSVNNGSHNILDTVPYGWGGW